MEGVSIIYQGQNISSIKFLLIPFTRKNVILVIGICNVYYILLLLLLSTIHIYILD